MVPQLCTRTRADLSTRPVLTLVTPGAQGNQVRVVVVALLAAELLVVNLEIQPAAAVLTSPAIASEHLLSELFVQLGIKSQARLFG
jgi:hypothetical protein